jgi:stage II sporulation protein GA (sporulation sigma-E factor processing peptidase)
MGFQEIYIEDIILDNLIINFFILFFTAKLLKINRKLIFFIISAIIGVIFTIFNLYINLYATWLLLYKFLTAITMILVAFKIQSFKQFALNFFTFLLVTALFGGFCFLVAFTFGEIILTDGNIYYHLSLPMWLIILVFFVIAALLFKILDVLKLKNLNANFTYKTILLANNKSLKIFAFLDTGNTLMDPLTGKPVNIITYNNFNKIYSDVPLHKILLGQIPENLKNAHYIDVGSVAKKTKMLIFEIDCINIKQKEGWKNLKDICVALSFANFDEKLSCGLLLHPKILLDNKIE